MAARLPLSVLQLARLAHIAELSLTEISGLTALELALFLPMEELETLTVSGCPALVAVTLTATSSADRGGVRCKLQQLDVSKNPLLASLPLQALAEIPSVRTLACAGCPNLWSPPQEVATQGGKECLEFVRAALRDGEADTRMTLFLLGEGEAGKTSVFRALRSATGTAERIREDMRTVGIDTEEWLPEGTGAAGLRFRVLDLAGQAVYEQTHQFYLLQRAVYLQVWRAFPLDDDRRAVLTDRVCHWMRSLQLRVPGACVMLVVTHIDAVDAAALDALCCTVREAVRECLAHMRRDAPLGGRVLSVLDGGDSQRVNCLLGEGVAALRERLVGFARAMPWYREMLPASFVGVRGEVERLVEDNGRRHISTAEWVQLCKRQGMEGTMLSVGTQYLHETGAVRFFGDARELARGGGGGGGTVYLSAEFMVSVMKGLVRHDRQALQDFFVAIGDRRMLRRTNRLNATGRLHASLVPFLWPKADASSDFWEWVRGQGEREAELWPKDIVQEEGDVERAVGLLEGFDLVVRLKDNSDELLVPCVLLPTRTQLSADAFNPSVALAFTASRAYPELPPGAFQRIVVRVAGRVDWSDFSADRAVFCLLGNVATLTWSGSDMAPGSDTAAATGRPRAKEGRAALQWRASGKALHAVISAAVDTIEGFFPGLHRLDAKGAPDSRPESARAPESAREPLQVLILAATNEAGVLVKAAFMAAAAADGMADLVVEVHMPPPAEPVEVGRVRVLLVCMTPDFSSSRQLVSVVEAHVRAGHVQVVPVLLAGFNAEWRALKQPLAHRPSADLRAFYTTRVGMETVVRRQVAEEERTRLSLVGPSGEPSQPTQKKKLEKQIQDETGERLRRQERDADGAVRGGLLPQVKQLLQVWRPPQVALEDAHGGASSDFFDAVRCGAQECSHRFSRIALEEARCAAESASAMGDGDQVCPVCGAAHTLRDLLASPEVRPCPACERKGAAAGGFFEARECRLRMGEGLAQRSYAAPCKVCGEQVSLFEVFPPEVYASLHVPGGGLPAQVRELLEAIELEADVLVWPARREAQRGGGRDAESRRALALAPVVLLGLTEEYAASPECAEEARKALAAGKLIVPVLLPGLARDAAQPLPRQGSGRPEEAEAFWRDLAAHRRGVLRRKDVLDWALLGDRAPLVATDGICRPPHQAGAREDGGSERDAGLRGLACEAAAQITSRLHRAVKVEVFSDLSRLGVRLAYFRVFIAACAGGRVALEGLTTGEVIQRFVKPRTEASKLSLCEQLLSDGGDGAAFVATAKVFLSHAWMYLFLDMAEAVERRFRGGAEPDPVVWLDAFSVSQHKSGDRGFEWWNSTFLNAVGSMGEVVMVIQPWRAPVPLTRAWCIFEAYAAEATRSRFSIAMTGGQAADLVATVCADPSMLLATLRRVCCETCRATDPEDRVRILDTVRQSVGFVQLDAMVSARMLEAVCAELLRQADSDGVPGTVALPGQARRALAQLRWLQGNHADSERLHREQLAAARAPAGLALDAVTALVAIASSCASQGKWGEAEAAYRSALLEAPDAVGAETFRLEAAAGLALACWTEKAQYQDSQASSLTEDWEAACISARCGKALHTLGRLRLVQGRPSDAERLLRLGSDALRELAGERSPLAPWHPDTLEAMAGVTTAVEAQGRLAEAEEGLRQLLALRERSLGPEHANTRATRQRLSNLIQARTPARGSGSDVPGMERGLAPGSHPAYCWAPLSAGPSRAQHSQGAAGAHLGLKGRSRGAAEAGTSAWGVLERLWGDLGELNELEFRRVVGLDRERCLGLVSKALGAQYHLRSLDLRCLLLTGTGSCSHSS